MQSTNNKHSIAENIQCSGCGVCYIVCPENAIEMCPDNKGFVRPIVQTDKCIKCSLCVKKCHSHQNVKTNHILSSHIAYSADSNIIAESSSGGVFSELAIAILREGGYVCGAQLDERNKLIHIVISEESELVPLRKSKYLEGNLYGALPMLKECLQAGKKIVFVGTPCQCAALRLYLGREYENLIICDFICHGVGSPKVFEKFLDNLKEKFGESKAIYFRHKVNGQGSYFYYEGTKGEFLLANYTKSYPYAYATGMIIAEDCIHCIYCSLDRCSDITLGDYVGESNDYNKSTIFVNSAKGQRFLQQVKGLQLEQQNLENVINKSWHLTKQNSLNPQRKKVFRDLDQLSWDSLEKKYFIRPSKYVLYMNAFIRKFEQLLYGK